MLPLNVRGQLSFGLLAAWSFHYAPYSKPNQRGPLLDTLARYSDFLRSGPSVVAGDFNNQLSFDRPNRACNHANNLSALRELGLVSAYHTYHGVGQGDERHPTHYWHRRPEKAFHIDYCFVPASWNLQNVQVGEREAWIGQSDHMPLIVDVQP
jgi:endonuclease/exonuclease/phosphatase family metal-dependent hydrolase